MKVRLSRREQRTIAVLVVLAIPILWLYGIFLLGMGRELVGIELRLREAKDQLRGLQAVTNNEASLKEQERQVTQSVLSLRGLLPGEEDLPAAIERLSDLANQTQVKIQTIYPQRPVTADQTAKGKVKAGPVVYKEIPIQIDAVAGYHQLGAFLSLVESGKRPMRVGNLRISGNPRDPKRHVVKLLIRSYFATRDDAGSSQETGSGAPRT